jgi:dihydrofolate reductase
MATSIDGYIAKKDGDSDWVSESCFADFQQKISECGGIIVGRRTFEQFQGSLYPVKGVINIVMTNGKSKKVSQENVYFVNTCEEALSIGVDSGLNSILLIGGGTVNGSFLKKGLVDEIFLSVHPLILGDGIRLFEGYENLLNLELIESKDYSGSITQLHYKVNR